MLTYLWHRLRYLPLSLLGVISVTFCVLRLTGNPVDIYLDMNRTPEQVQALTLKLHLDQPLIVQFLIYLRDIVQGDFGESLQFGVPAIEVVLERFGNTIELVSAALILAFTVGVVGGLIAAVRRDKITDFVISSLAVVGQSMPSFWLGILLIQFFALDLGWLPTSGMGGWSHLVLPAVTLAAYLVPNFVLITRAGVIETINDQFVVTARAKGLSGVRILLLHVLPNTLNPILSFLGLQVGKLIGGSIITESIYAWPGVGRLLVGSIFQRDIPVVTAAIFFMCIVIILANLAVDLALSVLDPRIRSA
jgi:peptide/nickel transport system permease protein/glutathione transport system permease protein